MSVQEPPELSPLVERPEANSEVLVPHEIVLREEPLLMEER